MNEKQITRINGVEILSVERAGEVYVPIKPICEALTLNVSGQIQSVKRHKILGSVVCTVHTTGADGKQYEMSCLPLKYVNGWLFNIDTNQIAVDRSEKVERYQRECYDVLYDHFHTALQKQIRSNREELRLMNERNQLISDGNRLKAHRKRLEEQLARLRAERLNPQPGLFD